MEYSAIVKNQKSYQMQGIYPQDVSLPVLKLLQPALALGGH